MANWNEAVGPWGGVDLTSKTVAPVYVASTNFFIFGEDQETPLNSFIERKAMLSGKGSHLMVNKIVPQILGPSGATVQISVGGAETPDGAITWEGPYNFAVDEDSFSDFVITGKYMAVRYASAFAGVTIQSYDIEYEIVGTI